MCFYNEDAEGEFLSETTHKARKPHRCAEFCQVGIQPGETYTRYAWAMDHSVQAVKVCASCERIRKLIYDREIAEGCRPSESRAPVGEIEGYLDERDLVYDAAGDRLVDEVLP